MKKLCFAAFVAFWASIATLLVVQATDQAPATVAGEAVTQE